MTVGKDLNGNFLKALAAKAGVELLQPQLRVDSDKLSEISKCGFLGLGLSTCVIGESSKALCPVALLSYVGCHRAILGEEGVSAGVRRSRLRGTLHNISVCGSTDRSARKA